MIKTIFALGLVLLPAASFALSQTQPGTDSPMWLQFIPLVLVFAIFFFLLILPQQRKAKKHKAMIDSLKKGDDVVTSGGIHGKVARIAEDKAVVQVEIADKVVIKIGREHIAHVLGGKEPKEKDSPKDNKETKDSKD